MLLYLINIPPKLHHRNWRNYTSFCLVLHSAFCLVHSAMSAVPNFLDFAINAVPPPTFIRKLCYKLSSIVTFTFIQIFLSKLCLLYWMASRVAAFAWYSVKIRIVFGVRSERRKVDKKSKPAWKLKHANSRVLNISSKFHHNWSLQFWTVPFQSCCIFWDTV